VEAAKRHRDKLKAQGMSGLDALEEAPKSAAKKDGKISPETYRTAMQRRPNKLTSAGNSSGLLRFRRAQKGGLASRVLTQKEHIMARPKETNDPELPPPVYFDRFRRWRLSELLEYERKLAGVAEPAEPIAPEAEVFLTAAQVRARYGVSDMWLHRRTARAKAEAA
jgi:hypothetical protein